MGTTTTTAEVDVVFEYRYGNGGTTTTTAKGKIAPNTAPMPELVLTVPIVPMQEVKFVTFEYNFTTGASVFKTLEFPPRYAQPESYKTCISRFTVTYQGSTGWDIIKQICLEYSQLPQSGPIKFPDNTGNLKMLN